MNLKRVLAARARLVMCVAIGAAAVLLLPSTPEHPMVTRILIGWNVGAYMYMMMMAQMMFGSTNEQMRSRALEHDEGRLAVLALVVVAAVLVVGLIVAELDMVKDLHGSLRAEHVGLAGITVVSSWSFTQLMFALHYAHDYYVAEGRGKSGGLDFPSEEQPDYGDFLYFASVIGTSGQTADVPFTSRPMRRTGAVHCVLAFFFNTTLVAMTINIASNLF